MSWQFPPEGADGNTKGRKRKAPSMQTPTKTCCPQSRLSARHTMSDSLLDTAASSKPHGDKKAVVINPLLVFDDSSCTDDTHESLSDERDEWGYVQEVAPSAVHPLSGAKRKQTSDTPWHRFVSVQMPKYKGSGMSSQEVMKELGKAWHAARHARVS